MKTDNTLNGNTRPLIFQAWGGGGGGGGGFIYNKIDNIA